jgi:ABC-2 type transport system ATP-binding protein
MYEGKLLMVESPEGLRRKAYGGDIIGIKTTEWIRYENRKKLEDLPFVMGKIKVINDQEIEIFVDEANTAMPALMEATKAQRINVEKIEQVSPPFDDVFVKLIEKETTNA